MRAIGDDEHERLGTLIVDAYSALDGRPLSPSYAAELRDVTSRTHQGEVLVAVSTDGELLGGVTFVGGLDSPLAEHDDPEAASIRMLAVDPAAQGQGVGRALVVACLRRAERLARRRVLLHTTPAMTRAHTLYEAAGFERHPAIDEVVGDGVQLLGYLCELPGGASPPASSAGPEVAQS